MAVRNPTKEEVLALTNQNTIEAKPLSSIKQKIPVDNTINNVKLKPKKSQWEPNPFAFKLPSLNKVVKSNLSDNNEIYIRRIGTSDENIFKQMVKKESYDINDFFEMINDFLDSCIKSDISVNDLAFIDKMAAFVFLLQISYGNEHDVKLTCPTCFTQTSTKLEIDKEININYIDDKIDNPYKIEMTSYGDVLTFWFKLFTIGEESLFTKDDVSLEKQMTSVLLRVDGKSHDGSLIEKKDYNDICANLNLEDRKKFRKFIADYNSYGTDLTIKTFRCSNNKCKKCKEDQEVVLPIDQILINANSQ